ncbi:hypothetical protein I317_00275 [Kwoniella heveanensis CBS 569]|nr:hypothetical protein I317_00275 [Kwoniella heveanensis CBS 569]
MFAQIIANSKRDLRRASRNSPSIRTVDGGTNSVRPSRCPSCATFERTLQMTTGASGRLDKLRDLSDTYFQGSGFTAASSGTGESQDHVGSAAATTSNVPEWAEREIRTILDTDGFRDDPGRFKEWFPSLDLPEPSCHSQWKQDLSHLSRRRRQVDESQKPMILIEPRQESTEDGSTWGDTAASVALSLSRLWNTTARNTTTLIYGDESEDSLLPR